MQTKQVLWPQPSQSVNEGRSWTVVGRRWQMWQELTLVESEEIPEAFLLSFGGEDFDAVLGSRSRRFGSGKVVLRRNLETV